MKQYLVLALGAVSLALGGCAINQKVEPVSLAPQSQICIVRNADVRETFLAAIEKSIAAKGHSGRILEPGSAPDACPTTMMYIANWTWDMAMYLVYARLDVYSAGAQAGVAEYNARGGGANMDKFINAEEKVGELVNELFP